MPPLGTLLPVTYTFLNLMGSLVCYSFSIARVDLNSDEWLTTKVALRVGLHRWQPHLNQEGQRAVSGEGRRKDIGLTRDFLPLGLLTQKH